ncbi:putative blue pigment (indigoidine) exporter [Sinobacterium caligoides]|uniref:Putative blue pigment (Indigoidine) exporter n=1 Tax=Sinobacterium caligoides TaxID=933926 RepID=A0A3N2DDP2_9GAMM|nr:EamA family transporter [Sinobacterium caligoides]ROR97915.1 putative blue pigment (indigoidine) exporter [Sinobacterium caligoides]
MNYLIAISVPLLWGSTYAAVGLYLQGMSPFWVAVWRALPAGLLLLALRPRMPPLPWAKMLLLSFFNITAFFLLLFAAAYRLPGAVAGTLGATLPLQVLLLMWLIEGKRPSLVAISSALVGLMGIVLLLNPSADIDPLGAAAALIATSFMAVSSLWIKKWPVTDLLSLTAWQLLLGGLMLLPFAYLIAGMPAMVIGESLPGLLWLILPNTAFAYWAFSRSIKVLGAETMAMLAMLNPMAAVLLGVGLLHEMLGVAQWGGIALIIGALLLMRLTARPAMLQPSSLRPLNQPRAENI